MVRFYVVGLLMGLLLYSWPQPPTVAAQPPTVKIMPMGDSITVGESPDIIAARYVGYRLPLYQRLGKVGLRFNFVGSIQSGDARLPDRDLEALGGRTIEEISEWAQARVAAADPDVILLMAGTNDAAQELSTGVEARYRTLLQEIWEGNPDVEVLAATIPQIGYAPWQAHVPAINTGIRAAVAAEITAGNPVTLVETPTTIAMSSDTLHPSEAGYATLADMWATAVLANPVAKQSLPGQGS